MKVFSWFLSLAVLLFLNSCSDVRIKEHAEWKKYFNEYGVENGCIEIYDNNKEIASFYNKEGCAKQIKPLSTFKIFNSLVALEMDVASDEQLVIKWDGVKRPFEKWNQNLTMAEAFKYSAVPYFQEIARRIGRNKMQYYLDTVQYGNKTIGKDIDTFWLDGSLKISADEQVGFVKRLYHGELPAFSERTQRIVRGMMLQEEGKNYRLYYKTGWDYNSLDNLTWMVGYVEQFVTLQNPKTKQINDIPHPYFFALNFTTQDTTKDISKIRLQLLKKVMKDMNVDMEK